jgi:membrane-associated phospholipid phosphatase
MTNKTLKLGGLKLSATDGLILSAFAFFTLLAVCFQRRVEGWWVLALKNTGMAALYIALNAFSGRLEGGFWKFFLRMAAVMIAYAYLFGAIDRLQLILHGRWLDESVLRAEHSVFGVQPTLWLERFISKPLTEWMMFAYVVYLPMYLTICALIHRLRGPLALEDYFFTLGLSNILCDIGFILFPVAGPIPHMGAQYTVPLRGYAWTWFGELIRHHAHFPGGTIPSPHCANATVMWIMTYRYLRPAFWMLIPIILSLYLSTVYGRYHYVTDAAAGVATGFLAVALAPALMKAWDGIAGRRAAHRTSPDGDMETSSKTTPGK